jgi:hypothetical protein
MIVEEQYNFLFVTEACLDAVTGEFTNGSSLVIIVLFEEKWLL